MLRPVRPMQSIFLVSKFKHLDSVKIKPQEVDNTIIFVISLSGFYRQFIWGLLGH